MLCKKICCLLFIVCDVLLLIQLPAIKVKFLSYNIITIHKNSDSLTYLFEAPQLVKTIFTKW